MFSVKTTNEKNLSNLRTNVKSFAKEFINTNDNIEQIFTSDAKVEIRKYEEIQTELGTRILSTKMREQRSKSYITTLKPYLKVLLFL